MIGVKGWFSANQATGPGIESVGTKPLLKNGSRISGIGRLLADSTVFAHSPMPTDSQVKAKVTRASSARAPSHSIGPVLRRNPVSTATARTASSCARIRSMLPITWPARTAPRGNRHRPEAGDDPGGHVHGDRDRGGLRPAHDRQQQDPRCDVRDVGIAPTLGPGQTVAQRGAEDVHEDQVEDHRDHGHEQRHRRVAPGVDEVAPQHRGRVGDQIGRSHSVAAFRASP